MKNKYEVLEDAVQEFISVWDEAQIMRYAGRRFDHVKLCIPETKDIVYHGYAYFVVLLYKDLVNCVVDSTLNDYKSISTGLCVSVSEDGKVLYKLETDGTNLMLTPKEAFDRVVTLIKCKYLD